MNMTAVPTRSYEKVNNEWIQQLISKQTKKQEDFLLKELAKKRKIEFQKLEKERVERKNNLINNAPIVGGKRVTEAFWKSKKIGHDNYFGLCVSFHFHHI